MSKLAANKGAQLASLAEGECVRVSGWTAHGLYTEKFVQAVSFNQPLPPNPNCLKLALVDQLTNGRLIPKAIDTDSAWDSQTA